MSGELVLHVQKVSGVSGSERHLLSLLPGLRERGWDARMLVLHEGEEGAQEFLAELGARAVPAEELHLRLDLDPVAFAQLERHVAAAAPAILHTHLVHADFYGQAAAALARVPARVTTKHGFNEFRSLPGFGVADRAIARLADVEIAISRGLANYLGEVEGFDPRRFVVVHYGIEAGPEPEPYAGGEPALLCVGRLIPIKGHAVLLRALARARRSLPGLRLELAGSGPLDGGLRTLAGELGLGDVVAFSGRVAPIAPAYERSAIVVVASYGEGFGMVALEAMERGRPVIATRVGGLPEIVADGETGLLVPPGDEEALAAALVELASDPERCRAYGLAGRLRALARFGEDRCIDRTELVYRDLLDRPRR
jgi:glycosyltransferase involved in cell wall biosynthesis